MNQFILGGLFGAVLGLLYAPGTGKSTRAKIKDKARRVCNEVDCFVSKKKKHLGNKLLGIEHDLDKFSEQVCDKSEELKQQFDEKTSELKESFKRMDEFAEKKASEALDALKKKGDELAEKAGETKEQLADKANKARESLAQRAIEVAEDFSPGSSKNSQSSQSEWTTYKQ